MAAHPYIQTVSQRIFEAFLRYHHQFKTITRRARTRFEKRDWAAAREDAVERLELYNTVVADTVWWVRRELGSRVKNEEVWRNLKQMYATLISGLEDAEIAETFFNSITRRIFATVGVNPEIEFVESELDRFLAPPAEPIFREYVYDRPLPDLICEIVWDFHLQAPFRSLERDCQMVAERLPFLKFLNRQLKQQYRFQILKSIFFRYHEAYIVGRICDNEDNMLPFVLSLQHDDDGVFIDAVLMETDFVSIVFSYTRSYFHVEAEPPHAWVNFLKTIMPAKPDAELYNAIGYHKHGKTVLFRALLQHLRESDDQFEIAPGEAGMVMLVFDLPNFHVVFKVIKDRFDYPKTTTREQVMQKYKLVFKHDRVGRLVDAQEFEHVQFKRSRFQPDLLQALEKHAKNTVEITDEWVIIHHLYTERKVTPLNLYLKNVRGYFKEEAVLDYGNAIKDLAAANIFPGDIFLKNFGVTRNRRVVFYDYDELAMVTECHFRRIPPPRSPEDELSPEPWFSVGEHDVFPEEFATFLELQGELRELFLKKHGDLLTVEYWQSIQERLQRGEFIRVLPYPERVRLPQD